MKKAIIIIMAITGMVHAGLIVHGSAEGWNGSNYKYSYSTPYINETGDVCCDYYAEFKLSDGDHVFMAHAENGHTLYVEGEDELSG